MDSQWIQKKTFDSVIKEKNNDFKIHSKNSGFAKKSGFAKDSWFATDSGFANDSEFAKK